ncbi:cation:proton antiporter [Hamadaea sp. NPDC051192]|uniref:cation:proton antiporter n=1 Tax=Hamadaea sp. NPDC051192 TaxID=3154940 RepID=UPI00342151CC
MTTDQVLLGVGLILVLAVGSQILASRVHIPALIVLLPSGFVAGALTDVVNPQKLLGSAYQPLVSLAVAVILYDAGRALSLSRLQGHKRRVVRRLLIIGVPLTGVCGALLTAWLLGMSKQAALMIGAILVVSGPTVVGPLLNHVRPADRLQHILAWEGSLVDPIGGILGALVFHGVVAGREDRVIAGLAHFGGSLLLGLLGAAVGTGLLWLALNRLRLGETLGTLAQLAVVVGVAAVCDAVRDDSGLFAAVVMGLALANMKAFDLSGRQPFFETLVQLIIGVLFVGISATVTPASLRGLVLPVLAVTAGLVLVVRPLVAYLSTLRTDVPTRQRAFIGWMAPRGIVAAATAATFGPSLVSQGFAGAQKILPATFLVIVMTVTLYGLTAAPAARLLRVVRTARAHPLLVGGQAWVLDLAHTLRQLGLEVLLWAGPSRRTAGHPRRRPRTGPWRAALRRQRPGRPDRGRHDRPAPDRRGRLQQPRGHPAPRLRRGPGPPPRSRSRQRSSVRRRRASAVRPRSHSRQHHPAVRKRPAHHRRRHGRRTVVSRTPRRPPRSGHARRRTGGGTGRHRDHARRPRLT